MSAVLGLFRLKMTSIRLLKLFFLTDNHIFMSIKIPIYSLLTPFIMKIFRLLAALWFSIIPFGILTSIGVLAYFTFEGFTGILSAIVFFSIASFSGFGKEELWMKLTKSKKSIMKKLQLF